MRILNVRNLAGMDSAAVEGSQETDAVEVEENYWGFGQFVPALLLILPLLSLTEAVLGMSNIRFPHNNYFETKSMKSRANPSQRTRPQPVR